MTSHAHTLLSLILGLFEVNSDYVERTYKGSDTLIKVAIERRDERDVLIQKINNEDAEWEILFFDDEGNLIDNDFADSIKEALETGAKLVFEYEVEVDRGIAGELRKDTTLGFVPHQSSQGVRR